MKKSSILIIVSIAVIFLFLKVVVAKAESCGGVPLGAPAGGTYTIDANTAPSGGCTFAYTVDGIEQGNIRIAANYTLTINQNQTVVWNPGYSVIIDGSIAINKGTPGGQLKKTYIWAKDIDNDGYLDENQPFVAQDSNPGGGSKRRYELASWPSSFDCDDASSTVWAYGYGIDNDGDNYGQSSYGCNNGASPRTATAGTDCDDSSSTIWVLKYKDEDGDGYCFDKDGSKSLSTNDQYCVGSQSGYVSTCTYNTSADYDCCETGTNATSTYSKQTGYFTVQNGCSSWDYNCNGTADVDSASCTGCDTCTLGTAVTCYFLFEGRCDESGIFYSSCTCNSVTKSCGVTWTAYSPCRSNSICYAEDCGTESTKYRCGSTSSKTCGCY